MYSLPNNCRAGKFSVYPSNWKTIRANIKLTWRITYWFYDDNLNQKKQIVIKAGINQLETLKEKQDAVKLFIEDELFELQQKGLNKITSIYNAPVEEEVTSYTMLVEALEWALENIKVEPSTKMDMKSSLRFMKMAIDALKYNQLPVGQVRRRHIKLLLEKTGKLKVQTDIVYNKKGDTKKGTWSANQFNHYRTCLGMLFKELMEIDAVEFNPAYQVSKADHAEAIRETLTDEERQIINKHLYDNYYSFWRFMQIYFHSGSREIELLRIQKPHVDLPNQQFKVLVKKGKKMRWEWRVIKTIALPLWQEIMTAAKQDDYLFSTSLMPGSVTISRYQITKRWKKHVKEKLKVKADFASLKHSNLDEVASILELAEAQKMAGHSTPVITMVYAKNEKARKRKRLQDVSNSFAG